MRLRKFLKITLAAALFAVLPAGAATASVSCRPVSPVAGEPFEIRITVDSDRDFRPELPEIPGVTFLRGVTFQRGVKRDIIKGGIKEDIVKVTTENTVSVTAVAENPGEVTIPPLKIRVGGETLRTGALKIRVRSPSSLPPSDRLSASLTVIPDRRVYVGETVRAELELSIPDSMVVRGISGIEPTGFAEGIFLTVNGQKFVQTSDVVRGNGAYRVSFGASVKLGRSGEFFPSCRITVLVSGRGGDFFFAPPARERVVTAKGGKLTVLPLPPVPPGCLDAGVIGEWKISGEVSRPQLRAGDLAEITLRFVGASPAPDFRAPAVTIPDVRQYPAQLERSADDRSMTVKYPFVALGTGRREISLKFALFRPDRGEYEIIPLDFVFDVAENPELGRRNAAPPAASPAAEKGDRPPQAADLAPFYPVAPGASVDVPLMDNVLYPALGFFAAGILLPLVCRRRPPSEERRKRRELRRLIRKLRRSGDPAATLREEGQRIVAEAAGLPPGATFTEISGRIGDPEAAAFLRSLDDAGFAPDHAGSDRRTPPEIRRIVTGALGRLMIVFALFLTGELCAGYAEGKAAFDRGDYPAAEAAFREAMREDRADPALCYDLGCARYMAGDLPQAYAMFERAALLAPWCGKFRNAADTVGAALPARPEISRIDRLLSFMRPEWYILAGSAFFALAGLAACFRKRLSGPLFAALAVSFLSLMLLCAAAAWRQTVSVYSPDRAVVAGKNPELCSIPSDSGGRRSPLAAGTILTVGEENDGFCRVTGEKLSGWVKRSSLIRIFPYELW